MPTLRLVLMPLTNQNAVLDELQFRLVQPGFGYIRLRVRENAHYFAICEFAHDFSGRTDDQRTRRKLLSLSYESIRANNALFADAGVVEDCRMHSNQRAISYATSVQHTCMTHAYIGANVHGVARIGVYHCAVLNVAADADRYRVVVST